MKTVLVLFSLALSFALPAKAQTAVQGAGVSVKPRAVIEMFTSQGCSSCPPADRLMAELNKEPDIIALTLPVDYWDYLGWKDTLALPAFTARQKIYAAMRSDRQVYTPQAVVNGMAHAIGSQKYSIDKAIMKSRDHASTLAVDVRVEKTSAGVVVHISKINGGMTGNIWVLPVVGSREVQIGRGENSGRSVTYVNVVRSMTMIGSWNGEAMTVPLPPSSITSDAEGVVVLLQSGTERKASQILGAGRLMGL